MTDEFIAAVKQCVADPAAGPRLNDLVNAEAGRLVEGLRSDDFELGADVSDESVVQRLDRYAALTGDMVRAFALGARSRRRTSAGSARAGSRSSWSRSG